MPIWESHQVLRLWLVSFWSSEQFTGLEVENTPGMNRVNPIPHGVFWITHTWGGQILPDPCNTAILKYMDLKFDMLQ